MLFAKLFIPVILACNIGMIVGFIISIPENISGKPDDIIENTKDTFFLLGTNFVVCLLPALALAALFYYLLNKISVWWLAILLVLVLALSAVIGFLVGTMIYGEVLVT